MCVCVREAVEGNIEKVRENERPKGVMNFKKLSEIKNVCYFYDLYFCILYPRSQCEW